MLDWDDQDLRRLGFTMLSFCALLLVGTLGYHWFADGEPSWFDCLYMTVITVSTIGYGEVVDISHSSAGRLFTMFIAVAGIGLLTYLLSQITAYVIEGHLKIGLVNRKIEKRVKHLEGHYIICGYGRVGSTIMEDLEDCGISFVLIDPKEELVMPLKSKGVFVISGDATDDDILEKAGIDRAKGLFAATGLDNQNLVITLSAKLLNPNLRVISRCEDHSQVNKMKRAGANMVISPAHIGGSRMLNEMVHPHVTTLIDELFYSKDEDRSVKSISVGSAFDGKILADLGLKNLSETLILAHKSGVEGGFHYNPPRSLVLENGDVLVVMTNRAEGLELAEQMGGEMITESDHLGA